MLILEESYTLADCAWYAGTVIAFDLQGLDIQVTLPRKRGGALAHQVNVGFFRAVIDAHRTFETARVGCCRSEQRFTGITGVKRVRTWCASLDYYFLVGGAGDGGRRAETLSRHCGQQCQVSSY